MRALRDPRAAIGLRAHSGWAALVAVAGAAAGIEIVDRRRIEIADPDVPGSKQPYHEAEGLPPAEARALLDRFEASAERLARSAFDEVLRELARNGREPRACGLLAASGRPLPALESILASHALIHAADGEHFRQALTRAAERFRLRVFRVREKGPRSSLRGAGASARSAPAAPRRTRPCRRPSLDAGPEARRSRRLARPREAMREEHLWPSSKRFRRRTPADFSSASTRRTSRSTASCPTTAAPGA